MHLRELSDLVAAHWDFDEENYPEMSKTQEEKAAITFGLRHVLLHQAKALGKLADAVEPLDHGGRLNMNGAALAVRNFLINTLQVAGILGLQPAALEDLVKEWASEPHVP